MNLPPHLAALPELRRARALDLLRDLDKRRVWHIELDGRPAYLKEFRGPDGARDAEGAAARLHEAARTLGQGRDGVALPILVLPHAGVLVSEAAPGRPLAGLLRNADPATRARLVARAGAWLHALARDGAETGRFGPHFWLRGLRQRADTAGGDWLDRPLVAAILARMRDEAQPLRQRPILRARLHGDLTPDNLFYDPAQDRMTGIDLQNWGAIPLVRDLARLLVWLESRRERPLPARDGVARADHEVLLRDLPPDQLPFLRFMIAEIALAYYLDSARQPRRRIALIRALRGWLEGQVEDSNAPF
ncbi:MAG: aminoglycoside phosphotransferase family protein [Paracoccus sp. (in: a-proteobacteria)]|uniref:phosphotransferase n=1 Tax=Paracoccus sp. TaxID=267 RepID=UPI0039E3DDE2